TGALYVGTDNGVYATTDGGLSWKRLGAGMPNVQVRDLELNQTTNTLLAGTYGRGVFRLFLDDGKANAGALRAVSGQSIWTGPVYLTGVSVGDTVYLGSEGTQAVPNGLSAAQVTLVGTVTDLTPGSNTKIVKIGGGTVVLTGANTFGGMVEVKAGVLVA